MPDLKIAFILFVMFLNNINAEKLKSENKLYKAMLHAAALWIARRLKLRFISIN